MAIEMVDKKVAAASPPAEAPPSASPKASAPDTVHGGSGHGGHGGHGGDHGKMEEQQASPFWLITCFCSLMGSGVLFGMVMEYATSGGRKLHELSYIFVTSAIYSATARVCRDLRCALGGELGRPFRRAFLSSARRRFRRRLPP